jgi:putative transposase
MRYDFIEAHRPMWRLAQMCRSLQVTKSGYFSWRNREPSRRAREDAELTELISASSRASRGTYGSPRIHDDLRDHGHQVSRKRVSRLMKRAKITSCHHRKKFVVTTDSKHDLPIAPNLIDQHFQPDQPNHKWVTDITYVWTEQGWLYLAAIMDLFSRRIVGWAMDASMTTDLVLNALHMATQRRRPEHGLIHHSDRGSQYASAVYRHSLTQHAFVASMSRKACCYDNAAMESSFHTQGRMRSQNYLPHPRAGQACHL